jgi:cytochrome c biogenesis protein CcmG, thiol:disulfide interchange protein DsbE
VKLPQTRAEWAVITVLAAILGMAWISWTRVDASTFNPTGKPPSADVGHPAPDFSLDALDGGTLILSRYKGRAVILNFWATWCGPCRAEIPALEAASHIIGDEGVILGVNVQEDPLTVLGFAQELGMTYPVVLDANSEIARLYRVRAFPTTYFIDSRGVIAELYTGELNAVLIQRKVRELNVGE